MVETPEQKYNRIAAAVRQTILQNFPNPNRAGCPGNQKLRIVAARRTIIEDEDWQHITHCSPCYAEFLETKDQIRRAASRTRTLGLLAAAAVLIVLAGVAGYRYFGGSRRSEPFVATALEPATLDLKESSDIRGDQKAPPKPIPVLPRRRLDLTIVLPFGSEAGAYEFQFVDAGGHILNSGDVKATISQGNTSLKTKINTAIYPAGDYKIGLRQQSFDWVRYPFRLR